jgi:hypothetical protein
MNFRHKREKEKGDVYKAVKNMNRRRVVARKLKVHTFDTSVKNFLDGLLRVDSRQVIGSHKCTLEYKKESWASNGVDVLLANAVLNLRISPTIGRLDGISQEMRGGEDHIMNNKCFRAYFKDLMDDTNPMKSLIGITENDMHWSVPMPIMKTIVNLLEWYKNDIKELKLGGSIHLCLTGPPYMKAYFLSISKLVTVSALTVHERDRISMWCNEFGIGWSSERIFISNYIIAPKDGSLNVIAPIAGRVEDGYITWKGVTRFNVSMDFQYVHDMGNQSIFRVVEDSYQHDKSVKCIYVIDDKASVWTPWELNIDEEFLCVNMNRKFIYFPDNFLVSEDKEFTVLDGDNCAMLNLFSKAAMVSLPRAYAQIYPKRYICSYTVQFKGNSIVVGNMGKSKGSYNYEPQYAATMASITTEDTLCKHR